MMDVNKFFERLFPNEKLREYVFKLIATSCVLGLSDPEVPLHVFIFEGSNGKSTLHLCLQQN
jgi:hypothetical protein